MNGVLDIWTDALWVHPEHTDRSHEQNHDMSHRSRTEIYNQQYISTEKYVISVWIADDCSVNGYLCKRGEKAVIHRKTGV